MLKKPYKLGSLTLSSNIFCSPLAGCSDFPFRKMIKAYQPGLMFCEMVKMDALVRHDPHTYRLLDFSKDMHPLGAQLCGSKPELAAPCARILEDLGFDVIDLNCGCPVDKVTKDGSGSGLLREPEKIGEILTNMISAVSIPVTVKIRAGWDDESINAPLITQIAEEAGAKIIFVHGRTRQQAYRGPAVWDHIKACVDVGKSIQVFGNGDVLDGPSAEKLFKETGCHGALVSRGTFGNPWLFEDIYRHLEGQPSRIETPEDVKRALLTHIAHIQAHEEGRAALINLRRISAWYLKKGKGVKALRHLLSRISNLDEALSEIHKYDWDSVDLAEQPILSSV